MAHAVSVIGQVIVALVALKALIWGSGGPSLRGWQEVVPREKRS